MAAAGVTVRVQLPAALREQADGTAEVLLSADSVSGALTELARLHPRLRRHLFDDTGALRNYVRVYVNDDDVRELPERERAQVQDGDVILIVPSIAGG